MKSKRPDTPIERRRIWLHRYAVVVVLWVVLLIFVGGQVKSTESGLSVPDWPNTYGHFMFTFPYAQWVGGIFWEHSHRLIASVAGLLTVILTVWTWIVEKRTWVRRLAVAATAAVVVQGVLGGLTVVFLLPAWLSSTHGTLAQIYFCIVVAIAVVTSRYWNSDVVKRPDMNGFGLRNVVLATTAVIFVQLILGAIMRHSEAGLAVPDVPLMFGSWSLPLSDSTLVEANRKLWAMDLPQVTRWQMISHLLHRGWALVVTGMVLWTSISVLRRFRSDAKFSRPAIALLVLLLVQVTLGILTVLSEKHFIVTSSHVMVGAVTLATSFMLTLRVRHRLHASNDDGPEAIDVDRIPPVDEAERDRYRNEVAEEA
jgi:cytochrome c oxidase assembly protein subunit 15